MEIKQALQTVEKMLANNEIKSACLLVNHVKVLTALDEIRIGYESDGELFVTVKNALTPCEIKNYKTLSGAKNFINKTVADWQQASYTPIVFDIIKNCNII
jgi:hypothetical protein